MPQQTSSWHYSDNSTNSPVFLNTPVYYPSLTSYESTDELRKAFDRTRSRIDTHCKNNPDGNFKAILGMSNCKRWTPYTFKHNGKRGRPPKWFAPGNEAKPHLHLFLAGNGARILTEKIAKAECKHKKEKYSPHKIQMTADFGAFPIDYVKIQSFAFRQWGCDLQE